MKAWTGALIVLLGVTLSAPALAAGPDQAVDDAAKARYAEGVKLYNRKKYEEARAAFLQAIALKKRPAAVMMLAESALKSGRWLEAMKNFDEFTAIAGDVPQKLKDLVENGKKEARAHLGRMTFDVPEGAEVSVDGEKLAEVKPIDVAVGTHTIVVKVKDNAGNERVTTIQHEANQDTYTPPSPTGQATRSPLRAGTWAWTMRT